MVESSNLAAAAQSASSWVNASQVLEDWAEPEESFYLFCKINKGFISMAIMEKTAFKVVTNKIFF